MWRFCHPLQQERVVDRNPRENWRPARQLETPSDPAVAVMSFKPGPSAFATRKIIESCPLSSFCVLFDEAMLRNIRKCIVLETLCISDKINWDVTLDELDKFIKLIIARGILGHRDLPVEGLWQSTWAFPMFNNTLSRHRFKEIMRFLRFDVKSNKRQRVIHDKFCLVSSL